MTAINVSTDTPSNIDTLERLVAWGILSLHSLHKGTTYKEAAGTSIDSGLSPLVDASIVNAADGTTRMIARLAIELDPSYITDSTQKLWMFAREFGQVELPAAFQID